MHAVVTGATKRSYLTVATGGEGIEAIHTLTTASISSEGEKACVVEREIIEVGLSSKTSSALRRQNESDGGATA